MIGEPSSGGRFCRTRQAIQSLLLIVAVAYLNGCATSPATPAAPGITAKGDDHAAESALLKQAQAEQSSGARLTPRIVPVPPGIERELLEVPAGQESAAKSTLAQAVAALNDDHDAVAAAVPVPQIDPDKQSQALKLYARARLAEQEEMHLQAIVDLQKAMELDPASPQIIRQLAQSYRAQGRSAQAAELFESLLKVEPDDIEALYTVGLESFNRRDFVRAARLLGRLKAMQSPIAIDSAAGILITYRLAQSLRELGYDRAAIEAAIEIVRKPDALAEAASRNTALAAVYRQRGEIWRAIGDSQCRLGEYADALASYNAAASLPSADPAALQARSIYANLRLGRVHSAQLAMLQHLGATDQTISDRDMRLCAYLYENAKPVDLLSKAAANLYRQNPESSALVRAVASLSSPQQGRDILKEFVTRHPRDLQGVTQFLIWLAQQHPSEAVELVIALVTEHPDLADDFVDRLAVAVPDPMTALAAARAVSPSPSRAQVEARLLEMVEAFGEAWSLCADARTRWPDDRGLFVQQLQLAAMMRENGLFEQLLAQRHFDDAEWFLELASAYRTLGRTQDALTAARTALDRAPDNVDAMIELAQASLARAIELDVDPQTKALAADEISRAVKLADMASASAPNRDEPFEILAVIYGPGGIRADTTEFRDVKERLARANVNSPLYIRISAQEAIIQRRFDQALDRLLPLYEFNPADRACVTLALTAWNAAGKLDKAEQWLSQKLEQRPGDPLLLQRWTDVLTARGRADAALSRFQTALQSNPNDLVARRLLENVYRAVNQPEAARALGQQRLLARPQALRRELELAALDIDAKLAGPAYEKLSWFQQHASQARLGDLLSAIDLADDIPTADDRRDELTLTLAHNTIDRFPAAPLQRVYGPGLAATWRLEESRKQPPGRFDALLDAAIKNAAGARLADAAGATIWNNLAQSLVDQELPAAAAKALRARLHADAELDKDSRWRLSRVALVADAAAAVQAASPAESDAMQPPSKKRPAALDEPFPGQVHVENSMALIRELADADLIERAFGLSARATVIDGYYECSRIYTVIGANAGAAKLLAEVVAAEPHNAMAINNLAYMRLDTGYSDEQTIAWIERASSVEPNEPNILDTIGWLRYKQGRFTSEDPDSPGALAFIERSVRLDPDPTPEVLDHMGDVHWRLGHAKEATDAWTRVEKILGQQEFRERRLQEFRTLQIRGWMLLVADAQEMYDREYGVILDRVRAKIAAVEAGDQPPVAPLFSEQN